MRQTVTEKIVQAHAEGLTEGQEVRAGDMVTVRPLHILTHDNTGAILPKFRAIGAEKVADPTQPVYALDHAVQDKSEANLDKYRRIEAFAKEQGIVFHPAGAGIGHQLMVENGFVLPGSLVVASDSHSNMYGALAAVGTPVVRTDAAAIWATGRTWWLVPRTVKVVFTGELLPGVSGKDVILTLCGMYNSGQALNAAVEFHGGECLSMSERLTISNMSTEWGALVGWFPFDDKAAAFLRQRAAKLAATGDGDRLNEAMIQAWEADPPLPDDDAVYAAEVHMDLSRVRPHVAGPHLVQLTQPLADLEREGMAIHKAYLLSCVNGRLEDIEQAAAVARGKKFADGVELYLAAASAEIEQQARASGAWQALEQAGAITLPPGCGACIGLGVGLLGPDEVGISATNRNFKGRMGDTSARAYLASPAVVAASAIAGRFAGPEELDEVAPEYDFRDLGWAPEPRQVEITEGFAEAAEGRLLLLPVDNLNTDGIYGNDVTYIDDLTPEQMASHAMANYDPKFQEVVQEGDIIVAGRNFGSGSSREQAATSLKYCGVRMVVAGSFSQTYLRNAFNNAFICLESPALADAVQAAYQEQAAAGDKTIPAEAARFSFRDSQVTWRGETYPVSPLGPAAQELVMAGGLEALTRRKLGL